MSDEVCKLNTQREFMLTMLSKLDDCSNVCVRQLLKNTAE